MNFVILTPFKITHKHNVKLADWIFGPGILGISNVSIMSCQSHYRVSLDPLGYNIHLITGYIILLFRNDKTNQSHLYTATLMAAIYGNCASSSVRSNSSAVIVDAAIFKCNLQNII